MSGAGHEENLGGVNEVSLWPSEGLTRRFAHEDDSPGDKQQNFQSSVQAGIS